MSEQILFDVWQNYEFLNIHEAYSYFFSKYKTETAKTKDHEMEVGIVWTFIRFIHKTDSCTFVKTRYWESEIVLVTLSYFIPP